MGVNPTDGGLLDVVVERIRLKSLSLVGHYGFTRSDLPDIKQDLFLEVWRRLPAYDAAKGSFEQFVYWRVEEAAATIIEHRTAQKRDYRRNARSVDHVVDDPEGTQAALTEAIPDDEGGRRLGLDPTHFRERCERAIEVRTFLTSLPDDLREICECLLDGQNFTDIHHQTGIARGTLYERRDELWRLMEEAGLRQYHPSSGASPRPPVDNQ